MWCNCCFCILSFFECWLFVWVVILWFFVVILVFSYGLWDMFFLWFVVLRWFFLYFVLYFVEIVVVFGFGIIVRKIIMVENIVFWILMLFFVLESGVVVNYWLIVDWWLREWVFLSRFLLCVYWDSLFLRKWLKMLELYELENEVE